MRETIASTWTMQLVFGFTFLFVSFLAVTISYSRSFRVKNEVISIIEKYGGYTSTAKQIIDDYIVTTGYTVRGKCPFDPGDEMFGIKNPGEEADMINNPGNNNLYLYCVKRKYANNNQVTNVVYEVTMFYRFNLPIVGNITKFVIKGKTTDLLEKNDLFDAFFDFY